MSTFHIFSTTNHIDDTLKSPPIQLPLYKKVLKDINFMELGKMYQSIGANRLLNISSGDRNHILNILEADSKFLRKHRFMDYSLYVTVEKLSNSGGTDINNRKLMQVLQNRPRNIFISSDSSEAYHFGVIDYLQQWN